MATLTPEDSRMSFTEKSGTTAPNQNPVQPDPFVKRFTLRVNPCKNLLCCRRKWTGKFLPWKILTRIQTLSQTQSSALILTLGVSLALGRWFLRRNPH